MRSFEVVMRHGPLLLATATLLVGAASAARPHDVPFVTRSVRVGVPRAVFQVLPATHATPSPAESFLARVEALVKHVTHGREDGRPSLAVIPVRSGLALGWGRRF